MRGATRLSATEGEGLGAGGFALGLQSAFGVSSGVSCYLTWMRIDAEQCESQGCESCVNTGVIRVCAEECGWMRIAQITLKGRCSTN